MHRTQGRADLPDGSKIEQRGRSQPRIFTRLRRQLLKTYTHGAKGSRPRACSNLALLCHKSSFALALPQQGH